MCELFSNILATIIGGLILTLMLFILNESVFKKVNLSGEWQVETFTRISAYAPYTKMKLYFNTHLLQQGYALIGSAEKTREVLASGNSHVYRPEKRVTLKLFGYYERKYLGTSELFLMIIEKGSARETRTSYHLVINSDKKMTGTFTSTAADSKGTVLMTRS